MTMNFNKLRLTEMNELLIVCDWLRWMNHEIPRYGLVLPDEETSVLFAARAVRTSARMIMMFVHFQLDINRWDLVEIMILRDCLEYSRKLSGGRTITSHNSINRVGASRRSRAKLRPETKFAK